MIGDVTGDVTQLLVEQSSIVARFVVCVVDSWPGELSCGVVFSGAPWLLDLCCVWNLCSGKRRRSSCVESAGTCWLAELL